MRACVWCGVAWCSGACVRACDSVCERACVCARMCACLVFVGEACENMLHSSDIF